MAQQPADLAISDERYRADLRLIARSLTLPELQAKLDASEH